MWLCHLWLNHMRNKGWSNPTVCLTNLPQRGQYSRSHLKQSSPPVVVPCFLLRWERPQSTEVKPLNRWHRSPTCLSPPISRNLRGGAAHSGDCLAREADQTNLLRFTNTESGQISQEGLRARGARYRTGADPSQLWQTHMRHLAPKHIYDANHEYLILSPDKTNVHVVLLCLIIFDKILFSPVSVR